MWGTVGSNSSSSTGMIKSRSAGFRLAQSAKVFAAPGVNAHRILPAPIISNNHRNTFSGCRIVPVVEVITLFK